MASLRAARGWLFAISAVACFWVTSQSIPVLSQHRPYGSHFVASIEAVIIFPIEATIFSVAWWSVWKGRASARSLGVAASLTCSDRVGRIPPVCALLLGNACVRDCWGDWFLARQRKGLDLVVAGG